MKSKHFAVVHILTGHTYNYMHYSLMGKMSLSFINNDLLYRGAL